MTCERGFELEQFNTARVWGTESHWKGKLERTIKCTAPEDTQDTTP